jgi:chitin synthase
MAVSEAYQGKHIGSNSYLKFLLWSVAAIALFRALGSTTFRIIELVGMVIDGKAKWESGSYRWGGSSAGGGSTVLSSKARGGGFWTKFGLGRVKDKISDVTSSIGSSVSKK